MPTRAELAAQMRELEAKRDQLQEQLAARQARSISSPQSPGGNVDPARMLSAIQGILGSCQETSDIMKQARELLLVERARAEERNDTVTVARASMLLDEFVTITDVFTQASEQLQAAAGLARAAVEQRLTDSPGSLP